MKIRVVGHTGMLGREVAKAVARMRHELVIAEGDITERWDEIYTAEVVINCAGLVPQRDPTPTPAEFMRVNGYGPWNLADWCDRIGARLIHVSTDCVFDGNSGGPYTEIFVPRPVSAYGKSKLAGEVTGDKHLTVRTSFVGFGKQGLLEELLACHRNMATYKASIMQQWTGHTARFIAEILVLLANREVVGLLHIPGDAMNRYELVHLLAGSLDLEFGISREIRPDIDRRLDSKRWEGEGLPDLPSFEWQLEWLSRSR